MFLAFLPRRRQHDRLRDRRGYHDMKEDITRLPQWAQSEFRRLRDNLAAAENRLAAAIGTTKTCIEVDPYRQLDHDRTRLFLPDNSTIRFSFAAGYIDV